MERTVAQRRRTPLYRQVSETLSREIRAGTYPPHSQIPTEDVLIARFQVSRAPIRQALQELVGAGLVYRQRGRGSFVSGPPVVKAAHRLGGLIEYLDTQGIHASTEVSEARWVVAPRLVAEELMIGSDAEVYTVARLIRALPLDHPVAPNSSDARAAAPRSDDLPTAWTRTYLNIPRHISYTPQELEDAGTVLVLLERDYGISLRKGRQMIWASSATTQHASELGIAFGEPVLMASLLVFGEGDAPVGYSETVHPAQQFRYVFEVTR